MNQIQEYFIKANSNAAPFFSDTLTQFVRAGSPEEALILFINSKPHPFGIYAANAYSSSDNALKGEKPLAKWQCNFVIEMEKATKGMSAYGYCRFSDSEFEVDGKRYTVDNPLEGQIVR